MTIRFQDVTAVLQALTISLTLNVIMIIVIVSTLIDRMRSGKMKGEQP